MLEILIPAIILIFLWAVSALERRYVDYKSDNELTVYTISIILYTIAIAATLFYIVYATIALVNAPVLIPPCIIGPIDYWRVQITKAIRVSIKNFLDIQ